MNDSIWLSPWFLGAAAIWALWMVESHLLHHPGSPRDQEAAGSAGSPVRGGLREGQTLALAVTTADVGVARP